MWQCYHFPVKSPKCAMPSLQTSILVKSSDHCPVAEYDTWYGLLKRFSTDLVFVALGLISALVVSHHMIVNHMVL